MELTCPKCGDALNSNVCYRCSTDYQRLAQPSANAPSSGTPVLGVIGGLIFVVGVLLLIGNVTGLFPTFPYAGFLVMLLGGWLSQVD